MRHRLRVVRAHALAWIGFLRLAMAIARGRVDQVWVGDSNAVFSGADRIPPLGVGSTTPGRWVWHLGPRLMFSLARDGFKPSLHRVFRLIGRIPRSRDVTWIFSFGEIDIRCHLAPRVAQGDALDFIEVFVARLQELVGELRAPFGVYMVPVPVSAEGFFHDSFPVVGTNDERRAAHGAVRERLLAATSATTAPRILALDLTPEFLDEEGWYRTTLQDDGVHPSEAGREVIQAGLALLLAAERVR